MTNWTFVYKNYEGLIGKPGGPVDEAEFDDLGWARYPETVEGEESKPPIGGIDIGVGAYSKHPDFAQEAALCVTDAEAQSALAVDEGLMPSRQSVYDSPELAEAYPPDLLTLFSQSVDSGGPRPKSAFYSQISSALQSRWHSPTSVGPGTPGEVRRLPRGRPRAERHCCDHLLRRTDRTGRRGQGPRPRTAPAPRTRSARRLVAPAIVLMLLVTAFPMLRALYLSLFNYSLTAPDDREFVGLSNYWTALTDSLFWRDTGNTVMIMIVTVAVELVIGFAFAMVMHKVIFARGVIRTSILIPYGVITVVSGFAWQFAFSNTNGFVNSWLPFIADDFNWFGQYWSSMLAIMASEIWKTTPFMSLLLLAGLAQVSEDMLEAAKVDGATWWQRLSR